MLSLLSQFQLSPSLVTSLSSTSCTLTVLKILSNVASYARSVVSSGSSSSRTCHLIFSPSLMEAVSAWESDLLDFVKAGGTEPSDEDQRAALLKILPKISMEQLEIATAVPTAEELTVWMRSKETFYREHGGAEAHVADANDEQQQ